MILVSVILGLAAAELFWYGQMWLFVKLFVKKPPYDPTNRLKSIDA